MKAIQQKRICAVEQFVNVPVPQEERVMFEPIQVQGDKLFSAQKPYVFLEEEC